MTKTLKQLQKKYEPYELKRAIQKDDFKKVKLILKRGVNINPNKSFDNTYLYLALKNENFKIAYYLLKNEEADSNISSDVLKTLCFRTAIETNQFKWVDFFVKSGIDLNLQYPLINRYLEFALQIKNFKMADYLVEKGSDVFYINAFGNTYLHNAVEKDRIQYVEFFLQKGLDLEVKNAMQRTCLGEAILRQESRMMRFLVKKGANIHHYNEYNSSFFENILLQNKNNFSFIDTLFELGTTADSPNKLGSMILAYCFEAFSAGKISKGVFEKLLLKLLSYGVDLSTLENAKGTLKSRETANIDINGYAVRPIFSVVKMLLRVGLAKQRNFPFEVEYSSELKKYLGDHIEEEHIPTALRTVALYSHYDQQEGYRQQRKSYLESLSLFEDPDAYYTLAFLCIYFPQRFVMHALAKWKDLEKNTFSDSDTIKKLCSLGTQCYWNTTAETVGPPEVDALLKFIKRFPFELIESIIRSANRVESVESALAQLPPIKSKVLESTDSRNRFRKTMYTDNYKKIVNL